MRGEGPASSSGQDSMKDDGPVPEEEEEADGVACSGQSLGTRRSFRQQAAGPAVHQPS